MQRTVRNTMGLNKRSGKDRRTGSGITFKSLLFGGRRAKIRRQKDTKRIFYVDHYSPGLFFIVVSILFLCVIDALLTLFLLEHGAYEINPVMAYFLKFGPYVFFTAKYLLTIIPAICLLMFRNIVLRIIKISTRSVLYLMALFYLAIVVMELYFVSNVIYGPELKLPPKTLTDSKIICQVEATGHHTRQPIFLKARYPVQKITSTENQ
jgi:Domain of unknown function (DUF5658)